jgi:hypothetical protein
MRDLNYLNKQQNSLKEKENVETFILLNLDKFEYLKVLVKSNNYMKYKNFFEEIDKITNKQFNSKVLIFCCLEFLDLYEVTLYKKEVREKYNLPINRGTIVIPKDIYFKEENAFY